MVAAILAGSAMAGSAMAGSAMAGSLQAQEPEAGDVFVVKNEALARRIMIRGDSLISTSLTLGSDPFITLSRDFSFRLNDRLYSGFTGWELTGYDYYDGGNGGRNDGGNGGGNGGGNDGGNDGGNGGRDGLKAGGEGQADNGNGPADEGKGVERGSKGTADTGKGLVLKLREKATDPQVELEVHYRTYPGLPVMRKWIVFTNTGDSDFRLEAVNMEDLETGLNYVHSVVHHNYGRMKHLGSFTGSWHDPVVVVHDIRKRKGIALGNEAVGVLKRTAFHTRNNNVEIGLTGSDEDFPFRKWLQPGESWESPKTFIALYNNSDNGYRVIEDEVNAFMVRHMQPRVIRRDSKPVFVYNTWYPFRTFINDSLVRDVAQAAAECGIEEFILDDGWQVNSGGTTSEKGWGNNYGDWNVDTVKFPGGLKPTFDYIRSLGMKPGLWISIGAATRDARVFREHPEWFIRNEHQELADLHLSHEQSDFFTSCFGTGWYGYIKETILGLVDAYGLAYAKLDFAAVTSAYVNDTRRSGCYATGHPHHRDRLESHWVLYNRVLQLFDELHREAPELFIDCTFETAGKLQLMDYAIAAHADGNWLSNFEEPSPTGPLRVRQMAWWRSPALPAASLVIGNQAMDDPDFEFSLKSLIGTLPIVLGDPRALSPAKRRMIRSWADWMRAMQEKYDYMTYRKDLPGFGEPQEGAWDGWQRINFQTRDGGIFGVFRQGAREDSRRVFLKDLDQDARYVVREAPAGDVILETTGKHLMEKGFEVRIKQSHDGRIFEVGRM